MLINMTPQVDVFLSKNKETFCSSFLLMRLLNQHFMSSGSSGRNTMIDDCLINYQLLY